MTSRTEYLTQMADDLNSVNESLKERTREPGDFLSDTQALLHATTAICAALEVLLREAEKAT